jgi:Fe-S oxidoreductase
MLSRRLISGCKCKASFYADIWISEYIKQQKAIIGTKPTQAVLGWVSTKVHEIAVCGFSCRHQIHDGVNKQAKHVVEILHEALK